MPNAAAGFSFDPFFCVIMLVVLIFAFSIIRASARRRNVGGYLPQTGYPSQYGPDPFGPAYGPYARRGWRRRRDRNGWSGGYGVLP